ncbi:MAG: YebC/PmpR family DNA-binding transcriptional regulator [Planctomycetota bacterium]|nr:MAG: YebC/PmpR family DNA-binding transcriptional regulator [Planctomycetota bacterium]
MAGHSHWANIQRTKSKADARRGRVFSKWAKLIASAARVGGGDPDANLKLRYAIERARLDNMPKDSIDRAIKKGTGELGGAAPEEVLYEGYGPGGVAILIEALTDNRARTAPDLRMMMERAGGNLAAAGAVAWLFERKATFALQRRAVSEDEIMEWALEIGAEDVSTEEPEIYGVTADPAQFITIKTALERKGWKIEDAALRYVPKNMVAVDAETGRRLTDLIDTLEDYEDVQAVHTNADFAAA